MKEVSTRAEELYQESELARYEWLTDYEKTLQTFVDETRELASLRHETEETAFDASGAFVAEWLEELRAADTSGEYPTLQLHGGGVYVPDFALIRTEGGFILRPNLEAPMRPLAVGESKQAEISGIYPVVTAGPDDTFCADVQVAFTLADPQNIMTVIPQLPQPIFSGRIDSRAFALLSGDVSLQSVEKAEFDRRLAVDAALAKNGILRSQLVRDINTLGEKLARAESQNYKTLEDVDLLKHIARQCITYAKQGACSDVVLADKLMQVFKKGTPLVLTDAENGLVGADGEIQGGQKGAVDEVFFRYDEFDQPKSLCIGLAAQIDNNTVVTSVYEIDKLIALRF